MIGPDQSQTYFLSKVCLDMIGPNQNQAHFPNCVGHDWTSPESDPLPKQMSLWNRTLPT